MPIDLPAPDRDELRNLLLRWQDGDIAFDEVIDAAECIEDRLWRAAELGPDFPEGDPRSVAVEVLGLLSMGSVQPLLREDIPHILRFLDSAPGSEKAAARAFWRYLDTISFEERFERTDEQDTPT